MLADDSCTALLDVCKAASIKFDIELELQFDMIWSGFALVAIKNVSAYISRIRRSILARTTLGPLVTNFQTKLAINLQERMEGARSASPRARVALDNP